MMIRCTHCGSPIEKNDAKFCPDCGAPVASAQAESPAQPIYGSVYASTNASNQSSSGEYFGTSGQASAPPAGPSDPFAPETPKIPLVFSIIVLVCLCFPLGLAALVFSLVAQNSLRAGNIEKAAQQSRIAKILCIVGLVLGIVTVLFTIIAGTMDVMRTVFDVPYYEW